MVNKLILILIFLFSEVFSQVNRSSLGNLSYSDDEIEFATDKYTRPGISKNQLLSQIENFDIIHFATHTEINLSKPKQSRFFIYSNDKISDEAGSIFASDLAGLNLRAKLAILSSCNTGVGKYTEGEGIYSIAREFRYSGCPSIIMTLWEVDDISTSKIIKSFYKNLNKGLKKDESLRNAKLEYLSNSNSKTAAPVFWAGAVSIGNQSELKFSSNNYIFILIGIIIIGISTFLLIRIKKN